MLFTSLPVQRSIKFTTAFSLSRRFLHKLGSNNQLYLHQLTPTSYQLSFSKTVDNHPVGTVKKPTTDAEIEVTPSTFTPDPKFSSFINSTIKKTIHDDFTFLMDAHEYKGEYMPIFDLRNPPNYQRVPEVEDIFGFVAVDKNGDIVKDSFEANNLYAAVSTEGPLKLSEHLHEKVLEELKEEA